MFFDDEPDDHNDELWMRWTCIDQPLHCSSSLRWPGYQCGGWHEPRTHPGKKMMTCHQGSTEMGCVLCAKNTYPRERLLNITRFYHWHYQRTTKSTSRHPSNLSISRAAEKFFSISPGEIAKIPNCSLLIAWNGFLPLALTTGLLGIVKISCCHHAAFIFACPVPYIKYTQVQWKRQSRDCDWERKYSH